VSERRLVSVLFADLVGFTQLAEGRDPEGVRELLSRYFDLAREVIERYGGTVEKFIGDAVMAVWGAPVAHEDDAERAVRAALDLLDGIGSLGSGIAARAGVLTGEAAVTIGAVGQGMVAGDLVNTASRLQSAAPPGTVLAGEATVHATSRSIVYEPAGDQLLKGKASSVPAWRAMRVVAERGGRNRQDTLEAPFVGRDAELRLLKELLTATGRERRARLVSITGQAGIGKSRLAWEFSKWIDGIVETVWWHTGRSPAYGEGITFWALAEMVRGRCGLSESDDAVTARARVADAVREWIPDPEEARRVEPALLVLLGVEAQRIEREDLFAAWRIFFERIALQGTVALVFEDLQWADPGLLEFIDHLLEWSRGVPILILTLARPELLEIRRDWGAGRRNFVALHLDPLPPEPMRELLAGLAPGLPEAQVRAIVERADGVPLYAVEIVRMLVADGQLEVADGGYRPTGRTIDVAVPRTLQALIGARLDALDAEDRSLIQDAAVLGLSFSLPALAAVSGTRDLVPHLRALARRELIVEDVDPRSPERGQYAFVQALIREVAYATIGLRDRRARHLAAARYFESLGDESMAGALAAHYVAAYRSSAEGPEQDALAAQARVALRGAAERASRLGSHEHATGFWRQALDVTTDPGERAQLLEQAGAAATLAGHHEQAEDLLRRALEADEALGDETGILRARAALAKALLDSRRSDAALAVLAPIQALPDDASADPALARALGQLARTRFFRRELEEGLATADRATVMAERLGLIPVIADTLITKGAMLGLLGRTHEAVALVNGAIELAERDGQPAIALRGMVNVGGLLNEIDPARSFEISRAGYEMAQRLGIGPTGMLLLGNAAGTAVPTGEWAWASHVLAGALQTEQEPVDRVNVVATAAWFAALRGEPTEELMAEITRLAEAVDPGDAHVIEADTALVVALAAGRTEEAARHALDLADRDPLNRSYGLTWAALAAGLGGHRGLLDTATAGLDDLGSRGGISDIAQLQAQAAIDALDGRQTEALISYREALGRWHRLGLRFSEALCGLEMVQRLGPGQPETRSAADAARAIFSELGALPFLGMLDVALGPADRAAAPAARPAGVGNVSMMAAAPTMSAGDASLTRP
jgi:class 3 adenylate cyclase/tetratricopeptide (TPR) repeat protein